MSARPTLANFRAQITGNTQPAPDQREDVADIVHADETITTTALGEGASAAVMAAADKAIADIDNTIQHLVQMKAALAHQAGQVAAQIRENAVMTARISRAFHNFNDEAKEAAAGAGR